MQHLPSLQDANLKDAWVTIGAFDGVHLGHRYIVEQLAAGAHAVGSPAVVLTFDPHPAFVLRGPRASFYLTSPDEKARLLGEAGADVIITHPFNAEVASLTAKEFLQQIKNHLGVQQLWVGHDFALGRDREGDIPHLRQLADQFGYRLHTISPIQASEDLISSSLIRRLLTAGKVVRAAELLGRPYSLSGEVEEGDKRGRTIGIPTANLVIPPERVVPALGVYACRAEVAGKTWLAVTNIGVRPTFEDQPIPPRVEAHLLDFDADIYGENVRLEFVSHLRGEQKFDGVEALVAQIQADIAQARKILEG